MRSCPTPQSWWQHRRLQHCLMSILYLVCFFIICISSCSKQYWAVTWTTWNHLWCSQAENHRFLKIYYLWKYYSKVTQNYLILCSLLQYSLCRVSVSVTEIPKQLSFIFSPWLISYKIRNYILLSLHTLYIIVALPPTFAYSVSPTGISLFFLHSSHTEVF